MSAAREAADTDISSGRFQLGAALGRWSLISYDFPVLVVAVSALPLDDQPGEYGFRFDLTGYPGVAPAGQLWDLERDEALHPDAWPTGGRADTMFNSRWNAGAIYHPMDRVAQNGHQGWRQQSNQHWWGPGHQIADYLRELWSALNATGYSGVQDVA